MYIQCVKDGEEEMDEEEGVRRSTSFREDSLTRKLERYDIIK